MAIDPFSARAPLPGIDGVAYYRIGALDDAGVADTSRLPYTVRVLLEMLLRNAGGQHVSEGTSRALASWPAPPPAEASVPFLPARVILQDFTGVPAVVDLAAMRSAILRAGGDPQRVDPLVPADLVIDHSVQVDTFGTSYAYERNIEREYERNQERYALLRWAQGAFEKFRVVPPGMGIVHQVNVEHLGHRRPRGPRRCRHRRRARHARRHRLAHDDDRRARHPRLGRRRHRGRGRPARRAARPRHPDRDRRPVHGRAARRRDGDRPRPDADRDAAQARRRRQVRRVLRRRPLVALGAGPLDALEHGARVRRDRRDVPGRRPHARVPREHGPRRRRAARRGVHARAGPLPRGRPAAADVHGAPDARPRLDRAEPRRPAPPARTASRSRAPRRRSPSRSRCRARRRACRPPRSCRRAARRRSRRSRATSRSTTAPS